LRFRSILILSVILLALSGYFYISSRPKPTEQKPEIFVWMIDMQDIAHIDIELPREGMSQAFIKIPEGDNFPWHFDDPQKSKVNTDRWGGGIPLLLSGPGVDRVISENATEEKLAEFGLAQPLMKITLTLENGETLNIKVGNEAPDGHAYYVQSPYTNDVALVDYTWYGVLERLVRDPPYAPPEQS
jgi:hypothetical protein